MVKCRLIVFWLFCYSNLFASGFATYEAQKILNQHPALRDYDPLVQRLKKRIFIEPQALQGLYQSEQALNRQLMNQISKHKRDLRNSLMDLQKEKNSLYSKNLSDPGVSLKEIGQKQAQAYIDYLKTIHSLYAKFEMTVDAALNSAFLSHRESQDVIKQATLEIASIGQEVMDSLNYSALIPSGAYANDCQLFASFFPTDYRYEVVLQLVLNGGIGASPKDFQKFVKNSLVCAHKPFGYEPESLSLEGQLMAPLADLSSEIVKRLELRYGKLGTSKP